MKREIVLSTFNFSYCKNDQFDFDVRGIKNQNLPTEKISIPHDIALSVTQYKTPKELYFGTNVLETQKFEDIHAFYEAAFEAEEGDYILHLNRVDVFAEVYLNGEKILDTNNAFIAFEKKVQLQKKNTLIIHLLPALLESKKHIPPCGTYTLRYNGASLYTRKPAHAWGWDIMPRIALGGIFDKVVFIPYKENVIKETYALTSIVDLQEKTARVEYCATFRLEEDDVENYTLEVCGICGEHSFMRKDRLWSNHFRYTFKLNDVKFWDVKNFGEQNLYTLTTKLYYKGELQDVKTEKIGIRTIELERTDCCDANSGEFVFKINGRKTFIMGTNWVPADALYSNADNRMRKLLPYMDDLGFNMVRIWGGGIYEPDEFYEYCDEHGILVWQDFMLACANYPQDDWFQKELAVEFEQVIIRLRNHASIAVWAGDNECDMFTSVYSKNADLERNQITRTLIPNLLYMHDPNRPYLPSSPYLAPEVARTNGNPSENHCWGPRDFFKSEYYKTCDDAIFISEIGYMSLPCAATLRDFISEEKLCDFTSDEYMIHLANMTLEDPYYDFRIRQDIDPITDLFGEMPKSIEDITLYAQIAGAEANKYFLERMRIRKDKKRGIMLWNMAEGWPELCEAFVDYYYRLKLAYHYVKQSQQPLCMMMDETDQGVLLGLVNDTSTEETVRYKVTNALTGEKLYEGECTVEANGLVNVLYDDRKERTFYNIEWETAASKGQNHFISSIQGISISDYLNALQNCGYNVSKLVNFD